MKLKDKGKVTNINKNQKQERTYELKLDRLLNPNFSEAMNKLVKMPMRPNAAMKVKRANLIIYHAAKEYIAKRTEVFEKYSLRDEKGELLFEDAGKKEYKVNPEKIAECDAELSALVEKNLTIPVINTGAFLGVDVSPEFLTVLDGFIMEEPN